MESVYINGKGHFGQAVICIALQSKCLDPFNFDTVQFE